VPDVMPVVVGSRVVEDVDVLRLEPVERQLDRQPDLLSRAGVVEVVCVLVVVAEGRAYDELVPTPVQRLAEGPLVALLVAQVDVEVRDPGPRAPRPGSPARRRGPRPSSARSPRRRCPTIRCSGTPPATGIASRASADP
jgi:hypothetical protein